jgi:RNA polymerase sigma-70 factor (ECF subfamily)
MTGPLLALRFRSGYSGFVGIAVIDHEILEALARGDLSGATTQALRGYGPRILGFLRSILKEEEAVQEVYAQFCEDLWRGIGSFRGQSAFRAWAYRLAHNAACHHLRQPFRRRARRLLTSEIAAVAEEVRTSTLDYCVFRRS